MSSITVDKEKCNSDGICAAACPARIIRMDEKEGYPVPGPDFQDNCIKCGHCVAICPTGALGLDWLSPQDCMPIREELALSPEQAEQFLCARRSIRAFRDKRVPRAKLEKLLEIACAAPSAKNEQPWHWTVVSGPDEIQRFAHMIVEWMRSVIQVNPGDESLISFVRAVASWDEGYDRICRGAPHIIIAHADKTWGFGAEDCSLALSLLDLYGTSIGLGTCWAGYFYHAINSYPTLFEALGLPRDHRAFGAMMVGYPKFIYPRIPVRNRPRVTWR
jgi:nitroreductase/NAD-dependent dihydropyrimidine dehydrogenase PreA subunit